MSGRGPKPNLRPDRTVKFRGMEDDSIPIPLSSLNEPQQATEAGTCGRCEKPYRRGDWLFRSDGTTVAVNCCAVAADAKPASSYGGLDDAEDIEGRDFVPLGQVLPTGRTRADMCPRCFQIPASNGACDC